MNIMFIEIPEFVDKFDKIATHLEMIELQDELIKNPYKGENTWRIPINIE